MVSMFPRPGPGAGTRQRCRGQPGGLQSQDDPDLAERDLRINLVALEDIDRPLA